MVRFIHVFNRSVEGKQIFNSESEYKRFLLTLWLSNFENSPKPAAFLEVLNRASDSEIATAVNSFGAQLVTIASFCIMPNHYHILIKFTGRIKDSVSLFMHRVNTAYSHFFNTKKERHGRLWGSTYKRVEIESGPQLIHVSRYIHCNPANSPYLDYDKNNLSQYPFSSLPLYLGNNLVFTYGPNARFKIELADLCNPQDIKADFKNSKRYWDFCKYGISNEPALHSGLSEQLFLD